MLVHILEKSDKAKTVNSTFVISSMLTSCIIMSPDLLGSISVLEKSDKDKFDNSAFVISSMLTSCIIMSLDSFGSMSISGDAIL